MQYGKREDFVRAIALKRLKELEEYCIKYGEWPKQYRKKETEKEIEGRTLYLWLERCQFNKKNKPFLHYDIFLDNGQSLYETLEDLFNIYGTNISKSQVYIKTMVERICNYIERYNEIPKQFSNCNTPKEEESSQLYRWLTKTGYISRDQKFIYADMLDDDGIRLQDKLDKVYKKYSDASYRSIHHILKNVRDLEEYCLTYKEWPKQKRKATIQKEKKANQLYLWLDYTKYRIDTDSFIYKDILDEHGISIKKRIDSMYIKYGMTVQRGRYYILKRTEEVENYCLENGKWPRANNDEDRIDTDAKKLNAWYMALTSRDRKIPYPGLSFEDGLEVEKVLKTYYSIFASYRIKKNNAEILNLSNAHKSKNIGLVLYYYIGQYIIAMINRDEEYKDALKNAMNYKLQKSDKANLVSIDEILDSFNKSFEEILEYHFNKYAVYSIANENELALLHRCLYEFTKYVVRNMKQHKKKIQNGKVLIKSKIDTIY